MGGWVNANNENSSGSSRDQKETQTTVPQQDTPESSRGQKGYRLPILSS